jgi:UDP-MurNAc hydroxylase
MKIKFLNHASILIETKETQIIFDPWFFGEIFNDSWSLIQNTDIQNINFEKLKYIIISHEHPDHFHIPTLKFIAEKTNNIKLIFPKRHNDNVKKFVESIGFQYIDINECCVYNIDDLFDILSLKEHDDSALLFRAEGKTLLNQNDAYLNPQKCKLIKDNFPIIDYWFFQFSLAGYYGNKSESNLIIKNGKEYHLKCFSQYQNLFQPLFSIPFASFVYFCKENNKYLNEFAVSLDDLYSYTNNNIKPLYYNDEIDTKSNIFPDAQTNLKKWDKSFKEITKKTLKQKVISESEIIESALKSIKEAQLKCINLLDVRYLKIYDNDKIFIIDYFNKKCEFIDDKNIETCGILSMDDLKFFFDFPWGADTLNITGAFEIYDLNKWKSLLLFKDSLYER